MVNTSATQPKPSTAGRATVAGLAILANPRGIFSTKTIVFDAQLYLGQIDQDLLIGSIRYFNCDNLAFDDGPNLYLINATFARRDSVTDVPVSGSRALSDYTFVGDIQSLTPLGPLGPRYLVSEGFADDTPAKDVDLNDLPAFTINPCSRPDIFVTGVAMECSKSEATFEMNIEQYISCAKSNPFTKQSGGILLKPTTLFLCHFPDSAKYRSGKPMPGNNRWVSIHGFLTGVDRSSDNSEVERFRVDIKNITFCGQYIPPVNPAASVTQGSPGKSLYSYGLQSPRKRQDQDGLST